MLWRRFLIHSPDVRSVDFACENNMSPQSNKVLDLGQKLILYIIYHGLFIFKMAQINLREKALNLN